MDFLVTLLYWTFALWMSLAFGFLLLFAFKAIKAAWDRGWIHSSWNGLNRFGSWIGIEAWPKIRRVPRQAGRAVSWTLSKLARIFILLILLGLYGIAFDVAYLAFQATPQYVGDFFVMVFKLGGLAFASILFLVVTPPFFKTLKNLAK